MPRSALPPGVVGRYALVTRARGSRSGERSARDAGHSVEFLDYRPYQPGDEPRAVDWRAYARSRRLYTRLYHAERAADVHLLLDTSPSMSLHGKDRWARAVARALASMARNEASSRVHLLDGRSSGPSRGRADAVTLWRFIDAAPLLPADSDTTLPTLLTRRLLALPSHSGAAAVVVISDLLDPAPLRPMLTAARARRMDLVVLQVLAERERNPEAGRFELIDVEDDSTVEVGSEEARAYRETVREFVARIRTEIVEAGQRYALLTAPLAAGLAATTMETLDRQAFAELVRVGVVARR